MFPAARWTRRVTAAALALCVGLAHAQLAPPPKPGDETPQAPERVARPATGSAAKDLRAGPALLPRGTVAARPMPGAVQGPGTQTEDDEYVGRKPKSLNSTPAIRPLTPQGPLTAPAVTPPLARPALPVAVPGTAAPAPRLVNKTRATGDEDEMEDLDIQRRKVKGLPDAKGDAPRKEQPGGEQPRGERR